MDFMLLLISAAGTLLCFWLGRATRVFPAAVNFENRNVPVAGLAVVAGMLAALVRLHTWGMEWRQDIRLYPPIPPRLFWPTAFAILAFGVLGYVDDRWGDRSVSGFGGHIRAALRGRFTTGFMKMLGGGLAALLCAWLLRDTGWEAGGALWLLKAAVIALSANALNLLDTRPARATCAYLALAAASLLYDENRTIWAGIGAALAWLPLDRGRKAMLGDAGSNVLGAFWGVTFVSYARWEAVVTALALLVVFHVYAERRSLNADIAAVPLLRRMDEVLRG